MLLIIIYLPRSWESYAKILFRTLSFHSINISFPLKKKKNILISICSIFKPRFLDFQSINQACTQQTETRTVTLKNLTQGGFFPSALHRNTVCIHSAKETWTSSTKQHWHDGYIPRVTTLELRRAGRPPPTLEGPVAHSPYTSHAQHRREVKRAINGFLSPICNKICLGPFLPFTLRGNSKDAQPGFVPLSRDSRFPDRPSRQEGPCTTADTSHFSEQGFCIRI